MPAAPATATAAPDPDPDPASSAHISPHPVVVIGGGPAGLMAAQVLCDAGYAVQMYDAMPSVGRKFLLAGKGGLNLTHSEPPSLFTARFGSRADQLAPWLDTFGGDAVRAWAASLGVDTFVGSSGRVFPADMKAAPLLRAWLQRLRHPANGVPVEFFMRHRWLGWVAADSTAPSQANPVPPVLRFATPQGEKQVRAAAVVLALGGASWPQLGSNGAWVPLLQERHVLVAPLLPSNCGFDVAAWGGGQHQAPDVPQSAPMPVTLPVPVPVPVPVPASVPVPAKPLHYKVETRREFLLQLAGRKPAPAVGWSDHFASRFAGQPFKSVALTHTDVAGTVWRRKGEFVATATGVEGSLVYAASAMLREGIAAHGSATFYLDLLPDHTPDRVLAHVRHPRGSRSLSSHLKSRLGLDGIKMGVLYEVLGPRGLDLPEKLAAFIKALPIAVIAPRPLAEAISTAGGVAFEALDTGLMLRGVPGVFCAGEMLDWEAPTGGYLLTACLASGRASAQGAVAYLQR